MYKFRDEVMALQLTPGAWVIFGSGAMGVRGLRDVNDVDILVLPQEWQRLVNIHASAVRNNPLRIELGNVEILNEWIDGLPGSPEDLIANREIIDGLPFIPLEEVIRYKQYLDRDKDRKDIELIRAYLNSKK
jgi:hypothetical protein